MRTQQKFAKVLVAAIFAGSCKAPYKKEANLAGVGTSNNDAAAVLAGLPAKPTYEQTIEVLRKLFPNEESAKKNGGECAFYFDSSKNDNTNNKTQIQPDSLTAGALGRVARDGNGERIGGPFGLIIPKQDNWRPTNLRAGSTFSDKFKSRIEFSKVSSVFYRFYMTNYDYATAMVSSEITRYNMIIDFDARTGKPFAMGLRSLDGSKRNNVTGNISDFRDGDSSFRGECSGDIRALDTYVSRNPELPQPCLDGILNDYNLHDLLHNEDTILLDYKVDPKGKGAKDEMAIWTLENRYRDIYEIHFKIAKNPDGSCKKGDTISQNW